MLKGKGKCGGRRGDRMRGERSKRGKGRGRRKRRIGGGRRGGRGGRRGQGKRARVSGIKISLLF